MAAVNIIKGKTITIVILILHRRHVEIERSGVVLVEVERSGVVVILRLVEMKRSVAVAIFVLVEVERSGGVVIFSAGLVQIEPSPQISHAKLKIWLSTTQTKWHEE